MTTSGFISPAREGKLPESRTPLVPVESVPIPNTTPATETPTKKPSKIIKKVDKKKDQLNKDHCKSSEENTPKVKKTAAAKELSKMKQVKSANNNLSSSLNNFLTNQEIKVPPVNSLTNNAKPQQNNVVNKTLAAARLKTEKLNTTITPIPMKSSMPSNIVDKLFTEPDKKKINILKKISNVKNEKLENKNVKIKDEIKQESRESSPDLVIDETGNDSIKKVHISNDITIELINSAANDVKSEKIERTYFDDYSPPGTPSTPKTPEMISQSPPLTKEKRKRKDKLKIKKVQKQNVNSTIEPDGIDVDLERPKTPEAVLIKPEIPHQMAMRPSITPSLAQFPFFPSFNSGEVVKFKKYKTF